MNKQAITRALLPVLLIAPVSFYIGQATLAASPNASVGLIDPEVESCMHKIVSKRFYNRISASDEQRSKLDALWQTTANETRPTREELKSGMLGLSALFAGDTATDDEIMQKAHELRTLHEKVMDQRLASLLKARKILTAEQRQRVNDRIKEIVSGGPRPRRLGALIDAG